VVVVTHLWTSPAVERTDPAPIADERSSLDQWLDYQRATLLTKCEGLTAAELKTTAVPPSSLSLLGLVRHMTDVERWWFRVHADGQHLDFEYWADGEDADFDQVDDADADRNLEVFRREVAKARLAVAAHDLDEVVPSHGDHPERTRDIRWIYVHMIEEYARHNGHADLLRERIDGATGD
jgi:uncharacterized damage-inducible protein DinB